jgi:site-specific recombinase XerD
VITSELHEFLAFVAAEKGLSENTQRAYERDLTQFNEYGSIKHWQLNELGLPQLREYLAHLRRQELSSRTLAR